MWILDYLDELVILGPMAGDELVRYQIDAWRG